jgi:23S rRNA pseudouridine2605 synthase
MRNNYRQDDQKRTGGGKRIGKSLENKSTGNFAKKSFGKTESGRPGRSTEKPESSPRKYTGKAESGSPRKNADRTVSKGDGKYPARTEGVSSKRYSEKTTAKPFSKFKPRPKKTTTEKAIYSEEIRLNRFIANSGVCSRREADKYIASGVVTINGKIITELGTKVSPGDEVRFDGRKLNAEKKVYLLLNKPKDFVTTTDDPHAEKTVMDLIKNACDERIYPVGRLDRNTTGVLLFTNDGDLSKKLTHPSHNMKKIYQVSLDKSLSKEHLMQIAEGVELEDGKVAADAISFINQDDRSEIGVEIHSGKNRVVRRIFEHLGYRVKKLDRVYFAGLTKKNLSRGKWRFLSEKEVQYLKMN